MMSKIEKFFEDRLVPNWRSSWRWLSVHWGILTGLVAGYIWSHPLELLQIVSMVPPEVRTKMSPLVTVAVVAVAIGVRLWKQRKPT